jgi:hypothetical protein
MTSLPSRYATPLLLTVLPWIVCAIACKDDEVRPATEIVVAVDSDLASGRDLKRIEVEILDSGGDRKDHDTFEIVSNPTKKGQASLPFSFGIAKANADSFQLRVQGFGDDGAAPRVQRTVKSTFQAGKSLLLVVFLAKVCVDNLCDDDQTCYYDASGATAAGDCGDVPQPSLSVLSGAGLPSAGRAGAGSAGRDVAAGSGGAGQSGGAGARAGVGGYSGYSGASGGGAATCTGCKSTEKCVNGRCECATAVVTYYEDFDGDGHGDPEVSMSVCGAAPSGYTTSKDDCCDSDADAYPGQATGYDVEVACDGGGYDYNCDGTEELGFPSRASGLCCGVYVNGWQDTVIPDCGSYGTLTLCNTTTCMPEFGTVLQICR